MGNPLHMLYIGIKRGLTALSRGVWYILTLKWINREKTSEIE